MPGKERSANGLHESRAEVPGLKAIGMSDRQKILTAAHRLQSFSVETLVSYSEATRDNVYQVLKRDGKYFTKIETQGGLRGRPYFRYHVARDQMQALAEEVEKFQQAARALRAKLPGAEPEPTSDLLAAESYILDQIPAAESAAEKGELLRSAFHHLQMDRQAEPAVATTARRLVVDALWRLSLDELAAEQSHQFRAIGSYYFSSKVARLLSEITPLVAALPEDMQQEVSERLQKSPLLARRALTGGVLLGEVSKLPAVAAEPRVRIIPVAAGHSRTAALLSVEFLAPTQTMQSCVGSRAAWIHC
jgi:hypothetical protein